MSAVKLYLTVYRGRNVPANPSILYSRAMTTPFLPSEGDRVGLFTDPDDDTNWPVQMRFWDADGSVNVQLLPACMTSEPIDYRHEARWEPHVSGDLEAKLLAGGWRVYQPETER